MALDTVQLLKQLAAFVLVMDNFYGLLFCSSSRRQRPCTDKTQVPTFLYTVELLYFICREGAQNQLARLAAANLYVFAHEYRVL
jgi:hypothetical protein